MNQHIHEIQVFIIANESTIPEVSYNDTDHYNDNDGGNNNGVIINHCKSHKHKTMR